MKFYKLTYDELIKELNTDFKSGLSQSEADARLRKDGFNFRVYNRIKHPNTRLYRVLLFLLLAALIYLFAALFKRDVNYVYYALSVIVIPVLCSFICHLYFKRIKQKNGCVSPLDYGTLTVLRDGKETELDYKNITYGDVVLLKKGDYVPFDARVIESEGLVADESGIGMENDVSKHADVIDVDNADVSRQHNMVFCSGYIVKGRARVVVTDISNRVYVQKTAKNNKKRIKYAVKVSDFSKILSLLLLALSAAFSLICAVISSDYISFFACVLLLSAAFTSDFISAFSEMAVNKCYMRLFKERIFLKSQSIVDRLNSVDTLILRHNALYDKNSEISGFVTENNEYRQLSEVNKSNFSVFLYSSFCNDGLSSESDYYSFKKLTVKVLKGVGINYSDIRTMCPVISRYSNCNADYDMCGIVYDGSNVLIARGGLSGVLKLCNDDSMQNHSDALARLSRCSSEVIAVAVKQVNMISADLSEETGGFKLVGFIGLKRSISKRKIKAVRSLDKYGVHSIVLFSENESFARSISVKPNATYVSYKSDINISDCDVIYDFDGDVEGIADLCIKNKLFPLYYGHKHDVLAKSVAFSTCTETMYESKNNDVISDSGLEAVNSAVIGAKSAFSAIRKLLVNVILFTAVYIVCGVLFSLLNKQLLFSPQMLAIVALGAIPITGIFSSMCIRKSGLEQTASFASEPLQKGSMIYVAVSTVLFILMTVALYFIMSAQTASGFIAVSLQAVATVMFFEISRTEKRNIAVFLMQYIPAVLSIILFTTPAAALFNVSGFTVLHGVLALISGILIKYLSNFISRSAKF